MERSDLSSLSGHWFPFMEKHQVGSKGWFRKFLERLVQQRGQEHITEVSGVTDDGSDRVGRSFHSNVMNHWGWMLFSH